MTTQAEKNSILTNLFRGGVSHEISFASVQQAIQEGADVNARSDRDKTVLMLAIIFNRIDIVKFLVQKGADVHAKQSNGWTAFMQAASNGSMEICTFLVEQHVDVFAKTLEGDTAFLSAASEGHVLVCKFLFEKGADICGKISTNDLTALMLAANGGHLEVCEFLIENGIDIHQKTSEGFTAFTEAAHMGHLAVCRLLVDKGINPCIKGDSNAQALSGAAAAGYLEVCKFLVENGSDVNVKNSDDGDFTPLLGASLWNHLDVCKYLVSQGADVNAKDSNGHTGLILASGKGHVDICLFLLESGAEVPIAPVQLQPNPNLLIINQLIARASIFDGEVDLIMATKNTGLLIGFFLKHANNDDRNFHFNRALSRILGVGKYRHPLNLLSNVVWWEEFYKRLEGFSNWIQRNPYLVVHSGAVLNHEEIWILFKQYLLELLQENPQHPKALTFQLSLKHAMRKKGLPELPEEIVTSILGKLSLATAYHADYAAKQRKPV